MTFKESTQFSFDNVGQWDKSHLIKLLTANDELQLQLFKQARVVRREEGLDDVLLRGVIEISNYCQKNCEYCAMRCANKVGLQRYRLSPETILTIAGEIKRANISTVFLQAGQDPHCDPILYEVIPEIKHKLNLNVLLCVGQKKPEVYQRYAELGADSYILKFETSDPKLYQDVTCSPFVQRSQCLQWIKRSGLRLGTGNIVGLPNQSLESLANDILLARSIQPDFVSSSPFIPNQGTPLEHLPYGNLRMTLNMMALYRIVLRKALIPTVSAMEKIQKNGQLMGLNAGANVMTINFTPKTSRDKYAIYAKDRFVVSIEHAHRAIAQAGLHVQAPLPLTASA
jgi:biotin synthase